MIKLVAFDLDGTVLDKNKKLDSNLKNVLDQLRAKGIKATIVSGRNEEILHQYVDELEITEPYVTNNGGNLYYNHKCLYNICIESKYNNLITKLFYKHNYAFRAFAIEGIYGNSISPFFQERMHVFDNKLIKYDPNEDLSNIHFYKITMDYRNDENAIEEVKKTINELDNTVILKAETKVCCVNNSNANKGEGLKQICQRIGVTLDEVMAFGDNYNDLSMIEKAGIGVVVENGEEGLKKVADYICKDNNSNGVSSFLKEYFKL